MTPENFGRVPRDYISCRGDRAITPALQDAMLGALPARRVWDMDCGHSPFVVYPHDLADVLMDGEVAIQTPGNEQPFVYRGFRMINEEKLRDLRGDQLRKINQSGMLPLIHAHLFSLQLMRDIFEAQVNLGKGPIPQVVQA